MILINAAPNNPIELFQPFTPIYVPIGIGYLLAAAEREGIPVRVVDQQVEPDVLGRIEGHLSSLPRPYFFGFSVLTAAFHQAIVLSRQLKERYPDSVICFGGIHPTAMPDEVLTYPQVDFVIRGEGEHALPELYRCVRGGGDVSTVGSLSFRRGGQVVHNPLGRAAASLDDLLFPYERFDPDVYDLGFIISSRGCPHACIFCSNRVTTGRTYRIRSASVIVKDLELLWQKYGKKQILFLDDNLLVNHRRIAELLSEIRRRGLHEVLNFSFQARGDNVSPGLLRELYAAGFRSVFFGLETASERIMKIIKKGETVAQCVAAVRMAKEAGLHVSATFIYALPTETHEDRVNCVRLSRDLGLDMVRFNNATPYPGTELYEMAKKENRLNVQGLYENFNSVSTFIENPFRPIPFSYVPEGSTEDEIRRDILFSYFSYYLDFARLKAIFSRPDLGVRWFSAGSRVKDIVRKSPALLLLAGMLVVKFGQLFYYSVIKGSTAISLRFFLQVFSGLCRRNRTAGT